MAEVRHRASSWNYDKKQKNIKLGNDTKILLLSCQASDSDVMFCLQSYQGLRIDKSLVY